MIGLVAMSCPGPSHIKINEKKYLYLFNLDIYQSIKCCAIQHQRTDPPQLNPRNLPLVPLALVKMHSCAVIRNQKYKLTSIS